MDRDGDMRTLFFKHVDVFTSEPFQGNSLAVFPNPGNLSTQEMQNIAREFNLSETTFVFDPTQSEANYKMRIFTPAAELPFAGHPSIGTAYVVAKEGQRFRLTPPVTHIHQEIRAGVLPIDIHLDGSRISLIEMTQGKPRLGKKTEDLKTLAEILRIHQNEISSTGLQPQVSSTGLNQLMLPVKSLQTVANLKPDLHLLADYAARLQADQGVYIFTEETESRDADIHARFFASELGVAEDPATGSAAGALGAYLASNQSLPHGKSEFAIEQGLEIMRPSIIHVKVEKDVEGFRIKVGGTVVEVIDGEIRL